MSEQWLFLLRQKAWAEDMIYLVSGISFLLQLNFLSPQDSVGDDDATLI